MTPRQRQALDLIEQMLAEGNPPSQRQLAKALGLTQTAVRQLIRYLKAKGYLVDIGGHRGLRLSERYRGRTQGIPIIGRVAAGQPILAQECIEGYLQLERLFGGSLFALKVTGDSMVDDGILDGDYVVVRPSDQIADGRIGVVLLDDEVTVKRVYLKGDVLVLRPANKRAGYRPISIRSSSRNVRVLGEVVGCIRVQAR
ncbi:MAG: transcriptional repressor LexA [Sedimentisphaerales bacterium]|nr:transcriptional repressor LexA [Sedimentisphaerales bacterium]